MAVLIQILPALSGLCSETDCVASSSNHFRRMLCLLFISDPYMMWLCKQRLKGCMFSLSYNCKYYVIMFSLIAFLYSLSFSVYRQPKESSCKNWYHLKHMLLSSLSVFLVSCRPVSLSPMYISYVYCKEGEIFLTCSRVPGEMSTHPHKEVINVINSRV